MIRDLPGGRTQIASHVRGVYPRPGEPKKQMIFKVYFIKMFYQDVYGEQDGEVYGIR